MVPFFEGKVGEREELDSANGTTTKFTSTNAATEVLNAAIEELNARSNEQANAVRQVKEKRPARY